MVSPPPKLSTKPAVPGKPVPMRKKPDARSIVTVTVLPVRSRSTVPKLPAPNPELELPCVRYTTQLVVETQRSADAGLTGRKPAKLAAATMMTDPSRNHLKLMFIESSPPVSWGSVKPFVRGGLQ